MNVLISDDLDTSALLLHTHNSEPCWWSLAFPIGTDYPSHLVDAVCWLDRKSAALSGNVSNHTALNTIQINHVHVSSSY